MAYLGGRLTEPRTFRCRIELQQAGYNAGMGHIYRSQRLARANGYAGLCWKELKLFLPKVTGKHSRETCGYIWKIARDESKLMGKPFKPKFEKKC